LRNAQTQTWEKVWEGTANAAPLVSRIFKVGFSETTFPADAIRIALNSPVVPGWNEIDAVQLYHSSMTLSLNAAEKNNINSQTTILYPNPSQGECKMLRSEPSYVTIFTILGETIFSRVVLPGETIRLPAGVYTARIFDGSNSIDQTLIIH
ncbi:MAG: T9SS type A sorting domain-containing protein, partial [Cytophagaceae bacterium]|nr:T9SS type A sorting domain-containing protein [Cytophagaceae bacterium]